MDVNFEILESQLSEMEMPLLMAVNVALNAALMAGADARVNLMHLKQHEDNFAKLGKPKAQHIMAAVQLMHKATVGIK